MSSTSSMSSIRLPYLGAIFLGKSPLHLNSFQKPLLELYIQHYEKQSIDERRVLISNHDLLIFEPEIAGQDKRTFIYANFQSIVEVQTLKLSTMNNQPSKPFQAAFLPIGCENEERFRPLYSTIQESQYEFLSNPKIIHPALLLFIIRKPGLGESSSLLDCHVFIVHRELTAFEIMDMIRKLIIKQTMSPIISKRRTLVCTSELQQTNNYFSTNNHRSRNPFSLLQMSSSPPPPPPPPSVDTSKVLNDIPRMSSSSKQQRHFIKASTIIHDESDEIVNDLMNIIEIEKQKCQYSIKRHASSEQLSSSSNQDSSMNKKRLFQNRKVHSRIDGQILRPQILINRYGDIGNYVPKFLRDNNPIRSSDSNENIFFRSSHGQLLNGFLKFDVLATNQTETIDANLSRIPQSIGEILNGIKIHSQTKRMISNTKPPHDYRQYLRQTDQGVFLYEKDKSLQPTFEHSLGCYP